MGIIDEEDLNLRAESPIERVLTQETIADVVRRLDRGDTNLEKEEVQRAKQEYDRVVVEAQRRLHRVLESIVPMIGKHERSSHNEVEREMVFKGHDLDYEDERYENEDLEYTQSGQWGVPLPEISHAFWDVQYDFFDTPDIELFDKYYSNQVDSAGKIEPYRSWLEYTPKHGSVAIGQMKGRVKTRESFGNKLTDKLTNVHKGRTNKISDLTGIRILAPNDDLLYEAMNRLMHLDRGVDLVRLEDGRLMKDAIKNPKPNGYKDLKAFLATQEEHDTHGLVEVQGLTFEIDKHNKKATRSHQTYKIGKYNNRMQKLGEWNKYRRIIGDILGEPDPIQLRKHELFSPPRYSE